MGSLFEEATFERDTNDEQGLRTREESYEALNSKWELKEGFLKVVMSELSSKDKQKLFRWPRLWFNEVFQAKEGGYEKAQGRKSRPYEKFVVGKDEGVVYDH